MNVDKIIKLAEFLERLPATEQFHMGWWGNDKSGRYAYGENGDLVWRASVVSGDEPRHECGTPACLAGWYARTQLPLETFQGGWSWVDVAADLGLGDCLGLQLFMPSSHPHLRATSPVGAAVVLRHLAATGQVDWAKYDEYVRCAEGQG